MLVREPTPGDWGGLVVLVAGVTWEGNKLGAQHIAERLTRYAPVLYVDPPRTFMTARRKQWVDDTGGRPRLRLVGDRLARLTPVVTPMKTRPVLRHVAARVFRQQLGAAVAALGGEVHAVVDIPPHYPVFGLGERLRVHLASDDFVAGAQLNGVDRAWVSRQVERVSHEADLVVAVSPTLQETWRGLGHDAPLMSNGCDVELFGRVGHVEPATDVTVPVPAACFMGTLSERTDVRWLRAVADRGVPLLVVGPRSHTAPHAELDAVLRLPGVQWVGRQPQAALPGYLAHGGVGLVPYVPDPFNEASFPLKTLDYLAAGLPVVASDLPAIRWLGTDLVERATSADDFAARVARALDRSPTPGEVASRRAFAARHGWDARVDELATMLGLNGSAPASSRRGA